MESHFSPPCVPILVYKPTLEPTKCHFANILHVPSRLVTRTYDREDQDVKWRCSSRSPSRAMDIFQVRHPQSPIPSLPNVLFQRVETLKWAPPRLAPQYLRSIQRLRIYRSYSNGQHRATAIRWKCRRALQPTAEVDVSQQPHARWTFGFSSGGLGREYGYDYSKFFLGLIARTDLNYPRCSTCFVWIGGSWGRDSGEERECRSKDVCLFLGLVRIG